MLYRRPTSSSAAAASRRTTTDSIEIFVVVCKSLLAGWDVLLVLLLLVLVVVVINEVPIHNVQAFVVQPMVIPSPRAYVHMGTRMSGNGYGVHFPHDSSWKMTHSDQEDGKNPNALANTPYEKMDNDNINSNNGNVEEYLQRARELKLRAEKERLEADKLTTALILQKISTLEKNIESSRRMREREMDRDRGHDDKSTAFHPQDDTQTNDHRRRLLQQEEEWRQSIRLLQKQMNATSTDSTTSTSSFDNTTIMTRSFSSKDRNKIQYTYTIPSHILQKRMEAYSRFSKSVKRLYARATQIQDTNDVETILRKAYDMEQTQKRKDEKTYNPAYDEQDFFQQQLLIMANTQAGYETLPEPIQNMVANLVGMDAQTCTNTTQIVERLIQEKKVTPSEDGGVEFRIDDDDENGNENSSRGTDRQWTEEEKKSAERIFQGLPEPMKIMLAKSVKESSSSGTSNSTWIVEKLIQQKKMLPTEEGVEFLVFADDDDLESLEGSVVGDAYTRSLLPGSTRKVGQAPNLDDVNVLFQLLGKRTFNPSGKPELIPGGYVIRGQTEIDDGDELIAKIEQELSKTTAAGKLNVFYIPDPTMITQEQFDNDSYELPLIMVLGSDLSPDTNPMVKPVISIFGGLSISAVSVATCLSTNPNMDMSALEDMTGSLALGIFATLLAHETAHQVVAWKDKFRAGVPTIIPSVQLGLEGCITPILSPPKNLKSLFDFALAGPLVGMCVSVILLYSGLEQQVFLDAAAQANLPSLPVNVVRSSGLAGGMIEWLLGEGTLYSADPYALIRLHPYAIAGFIGIVTNAFSLLPIGNTDGGRIALSVFGRSFLRFARSLTLGLLILAGLFGSDQANLLIVYAIIAQIWMSEPEIPCKNEVDGIDDIRLVIGIAVAVLVGLAVVPLPS